MGNPSRVARELGWASCLASAARIIVASGTTFLQISALVALIGQRSAKRVSCLDLVSKKEIRIKEVKINAAKPTVIE